DGHVVAGLDQRSGLLPDAPVVGIGLVLEQDEEPLSQWLILVEALARSRRSCSRLTKRTTSVSARGSLLTAAPSQPAAYATLPSTRGGLRTRTATLAATLSGCAP